MTLLLAVLAALGALALGALGYHLWQLHALRRWLARPEPGAAPEAPGAWWDEVFAQLHRRERGHNAERARLLRLVARSAQAGRALPDGVLILDAERRIEWCNNRAEAYLGIDRRRDAWQPIANLVRDPEFVRYLEAGDFAAAVRFRPVRRPGLSLAVQMIPYGESQTLMLVRDVTQEERIETMRRDFVANVSHELRTPLTVLSGFLDTIRELKLDPERTRDYLGMMAEQARRMQRIIEDLLALSALESAPEPPRDARVPVAALLARVDAEARALSSGRHRVTLDAAGEFDLLGAESELASAFSNLASNAVRYTPEGGAIRLVWRAGAEGASFSVEDTGIGIAAEHLPRLTERFYRVDRGRSRDTGGTGLGLAIVKHALARHDARLEIESEPGKGSRFTARFPARRLAAALDAGAAAPPEPRNL